MVYLALVRENGRPLGRRPRFLDWGKGLIVVAGGSEYLFYVFDGKNLNGYDEGIQDDTEIQVFSPTWNNLRINNMTGILFYLFWYWFSAGKYLIYFVKNEGEVVHVSHVLTRNPKFAFMAGKDREIGPCWTHPGFRGRGLYSRVLRRIAGDLGQGDGRLFVFAEEKNAASLKGIAKAGFSYFGAGIKSSPWGIYRVTSRSGRERDV